LRAHLGHASTPGPTREAARERPGIEVREP
jgi:hypothetical protein